jgi:hypothetical protein
MPPCGLHDRGDQKYDHLLQPVRLPPEKRTSMGVLHLRQVVAVRSRTRSLLLAAAAVALLLVGPTAVSAATISGNTLTGVEGQPLAAGVGAVLAQTDLGDVSGVSIDWGDGTHDPCVFYSGPAFPTTAPGACWFWRGQADSYAAAVFGVHTYSLPDAVYVDGSLQTNAPYQWSITDGGETILGSAAIADAPLSPGGGVAIKALTGIAEPTTVANFRDSDPHGQPGNYQTTVTWGDGTPTDTTATVSGGGGTGFRVSDAHAYANPGTYTVTTTITDHIPGRASYGPITITSHATAATTGAEAIAAQEGTRVSGVIAKYCGQSGLPSSVAVSWGDGSALDTATTVTTVAGGCHTVSAGHTYVESTANARTFRVTPRPASWAGPVSGTATVSDAPLSAAWDGPAVAAAGSSFTFPDTQLATIHDANPDAPSCTSSASCDITATISWGDGTTSPATLTALAGGGLGVHGSHTYRGPGYYAMTVTAADRGGSSVQATGAFRVAFPPPETAGCLGTVPAVGATTGLYGVSPPSGRPNWGITSDDRVVRTGNLVVCAIDAPWTYDGGSSSAGTFQATGPIIVNGIELIPATGDANVPYVISTQGDGQISGPQSQAWITKADHLAQPGLRGELGSANLTGDPWVLEGSTLAVMTASAASSVDGLPITGTVPIRISGLGTSQIPATIRLPSAFTLGASSGGPVTSTHTFAAGYPALAVSGESAGLPPFRNDGYLCSLPTPPGLPVHLTFPSAFVGGMPVTNGYLDYDPSTGTADGGALFSIGGARVSGFFAFHNGSFADAGGCASGLAAPIIPELLQLDGISFNAFLDPTRFRATATLGLVGLGTAGSVIDLQGGTMVVFGSNRFPYQYDADKAVTGQDDIPGTSSILYTHPFTTTTIGIAGQYSPFGLPLQINGYVLYVYPSYVEFGGGWNVNVLNGALSASLTSAGQLWLAQHEFDIEAHGSVSVAGFHSGADIVVSNIGIIGCANVDIPNGVGGVLATLSEGAAYRWGQGLSGVNIWLFGGCNNNFGSYRVSASSGSLVRRSAGAPGVGSPTFTIGHGLPDAMVRLTGAGGAPAATITGPGGQQATTGADGTVSGTTSVAAVRFGRFDTTWIGLHRPTAGRWTVTPLAGSVRITSVAVADGLAAASVHATVTGRGYHRALRYVVRLRPGQRVQFAESGTGTGQLIGTARGARGALAFTPAIGPAGRRRIIALISLAGLPSQRSVVASYLAPGPPVAQAPPHLRAAHLGLTLRLSWRAGAYTTAYRVTVVSTDGRRLLYLLPRGARALSVPNPLGGGAIVTVAGVGPDGNVGPAATVRVAAPSRPGRVRALTITRSAHAVRVSWAAASGARDYRVTIIVGSGRPSLTVTRGRALRVTGTGSAALRVTVQAEGTIDVLGPASSARLPALRRPGRA